MIDRSLEIDKWELLLDWLVDNRDDDDGRAGWIDAFTGVSASKYAPVTYGRRRAD
jgi:hypothetical protein